MGFWLGEVPWEGPNGRSFVGGILWEEFRGMDPMGEVSWEESYGRSSVRGLQVGSCPVGGILWEEFQWNQMYCIIIELGKKTISFTE